MADLQGSTIGVGTLRESIPGSIDRTTVGLRDGGNIFRRLQATFDLQRTDTGADEVGDHLDTCQVLRGKQVGLVTEVAHHSVDHELIGKAAGLGAFAAIGRTTAKGFTRQALAGVGDTEGAVDEDLEIERSALSGLLRLHLLHLRNRNLATKDGERGS